MSQLMLRPTVTMDVPILLRFEADSETARWVGQSAWEWHATAIGVANREHLVGEMAGDLIGFVVLVGLTDRNAGIELRRIVVRPDRRGRGLGRALLRAAVNRCFLDHETHRVWLDVKVGNERARGLYRDEGFVDEGTLREAYLEPDGRRTSLRLMSVLRREWAARTADTYV